MRGLSTLVLITGLIIVYLALPDGNAVSTFQIAAVGVGVVLAVTILVDVRRDWRQLVRADIFILLALYGLTFAEFLLPNTYLMLGQFDKNATAAVGAVLLGMCSVAVGRHLVPDYRHAGTKATQFLPNLKSSQVVLLLSISMFLGFLYILISTGFNPVRLWNGMMVDRWSRPWARGHTGGFASLLSELRLLLYIVPPAAGVVMARPLEYSRGVRSLVLFYATVVMFFSFTEGTRYVFFVQTAGLTVAYILSKPGITFARVLLISSCAFLLFVFASIHMLNFRNMGLERYFSGEVNVAYEEGTMVDNNLFAISGLLSAFPSKVDYLGLEIPFRALSLPIPRAFWPGKPEGLSTESASALGLEGLSVSATFVGEGYMSGGYIGIIIFGLLFGVFGGWWNKFSRTRSNLDIAFYASGFFAIAVGSRSIMFVVVGLLPSLAIWVLGRRLSRRAFKHRNMIR